MVLEGRIGTTLVTRPQALRRVLGNLIDNALKYGGNARIIAAASPADTPLTILVRDSGPGIPEDLLEAVFEPFYRVEESRSRNASGTGLGLAISRQLTLMMGATLSLHNLAEGGLEARLGVPKMS